MIRYSQQDAQWKDKQLGVGEHTIGQAGCLLTCFAMAAQYAGANYNPATLNDALVNVRGFSGSLLMPAMVDSILSGLKITAQHVCRDVPAPVSTINKYLADSSALVIVEIDSSPDPGQQSHWVILTAAEGGDYVMVDPWPLVETGKVTLLGRYGKGRTAAAIITYVIALGVDYPPASTEPEKYPEKSTVKVSSRGLRGRTEPGTSSPIAIDPLKVGLEFEKCTDKPVIKDNNEWIAVKLWIARGPADGSYKYLE